MSMDSMIRSLLRIQGARNAAREGLSKAEWWGQRSPRSLKRTARKKPTNEREHLLQIILTMDDSEVSKVLYYILEDDSNWEDTDD